MPEPINSSPQRPAAVGSTRFRLARLARVAALGVPGVAGTDAGPMGLFITVGGGERLEGVICAAAPGGGYDVSLRLRCELLPLVGLAEQVQMAVARAAIAGQISVASVDVAIADVIDPETAR